MKQAKNLITIILSAFILFALIFPSAAFAAQGGIALTPENSAEIEQTLRSLIDENKDKIAALSLTVFSLDEDLCTIHYGYANKTEHISADENTVYEWGSITKLLTWVSAMQLYEQGKLDLNEDIRTYLPKGFLTNLSYSEPVTMLHLMNHTAGFQENLWEQESPDHSRIKPLDEALKATAPAQVNAPGKVASYSNWGAALAGYIVECISGQSFTEYVHEHIFKPLGMEHTSISPDCSDNEWVAENRKYTHCYIYDTDDDGNIVEEDRGECRSYIFLYPAGAATGTISDLEIFAKAFISDNCPLFEKQDTLTEMLTPSCCNSDGSIKMCHGIFFGDFGDGVYGHGGATEGFSSDLQLDIVNKTGVVYMTNTHSQFSSDDIITALYGTYEIPETDNFTRVDLSGHYSIGRSMFGAGMLKAYGFLEDDLYLEDMGDGSFGAYGGVVQFTQVSDTAVKAKMPSGKINNFIIRKGADGKIEALESYHAIEYTKVNDGEYTFKLISLYVLAAAVAIMVGLFVMHCILLRKYKEQPVWKFKQLELIACAMPIVSVLAVAVTYFRYLPMQPVNLLAIPSLLISVSSIASLVLLVLAWARKDKPKCKVPPIIETVCAVIIIAGIVYWKLYQFWGF